MLVFQTRNPAAVIEMQRDLGFLPESGTEESAPGIRETHQTTVERGILRCGQQQAIVDAEPIGIEFALRPRQRSNGNREIDKSACRPS